ncbi:MAG: FadR family transcriptional regulator [Clostridia bacterium]|nr:FadR family transcriptional regulator [Clostridia bacterium]
MKFEPVQKKRIYEDIVKQVLNQINSGILKPGDKLPAEREMSSLLNTSRNSVSEAYRTLEVRGFVEIRPGGGAFIKEVDLNSVFKPFSQMISDDYRLILDTLDARDVIETEVAKLVACRANDQEIEQIKDIIAESKKAVKTGSNGLKYDDDFHMALANASHNKIYAMIMNLIKDALTKSREATLNIAGQPSKTVDDHEEILNAIISGDSEKAGIVMRKHLKKARENIIDIINKE